MLVRRTSALLALVFLFVACSSSPPAVGEDASSVVDQAAMDTSPERDAGPTPDLPSVDAARDSLAPDVLSPDILTPDTLSPDVLPPDVMPTPDLVSPLSVVVTYPPRASMLTGSSTVVVTGKVVGPLSSLDSLTVNGKAVNPSAAGTFSVPMSAAWGLNIITVECVDKAARHVNVAQSFHYSSTYRGMSSSPTSIAVPKGAVARLYKKAIDDGDRSTVNDLATILEKVFNNTDLDALIPSTLASGKVLFVNWNVTKNGTLTYAPIKLSLAPRTGGISLSGSAAWLKLPLRAKAGVTVSGSVNVTNMKVSGDINISKSSGGPVSVSVPSLSVSFDSVKVSIGSGIGGKILSAIVNAVVSLFKNSIRKKFEDEFKKAIPAPVKSFISGFKFATGFNLPAQLGGKRLNIYSSIDQIGFDSYGGNLWLRTAVYGSKGIASGKRGSIARSSSYKPLTYSSRAMRVALRYDTLNQAVCAAWYTGALKQDLSQLVLAQIKPGSLPFTISGLKLTVEPLLPPILMPGTQGHDFDVAAGDLYVKAEVTIAGASGGKLSANLYASAVTGADVRLTSQNELELTLSSKLKRFEAELQNMSFSGSNFPSPGEVSKALEDLVAKSLPNLVPSIIQKLPIPAVDLSALGGSYGIPAGTVLKLKNGSLTLKSSYVVMAGDL